MAEPADEFYTDGTLAMTTPSFGAFDEIDGKNGDKLWDVYIDYLGGQLLTLTGAPKNPVFEDNEDRVVTKMETQDLLDGFVCRGWGGQSSMETLLRDVMRYEYDFNGPTTCPVIGEGP